MASPTLVLTVSALLAGSMIPPGAAGFAADADPRSGPSTSERRRDNVERGNAALDAGEAAMKDKDYEKATAYFKNAADLIPDVPKTRSLHEHAINLFCEASVKLATQLITEGRYQLAEDTLKVVLDEHYDPRCHRAIVLLSHLEQPDYFNKTITPKFRGNIEQVKQWFIEAQGLYDTGRFDLAKQRCERILNVDPYNRAAREFEEKIERARDDYGIAAYNHARSKLLADADGSTWTSERKFDSGMQVAPGTEKIRKKLEQIIIPKLEWHEATIGEAVDFLKKKSVELDEQSPVTERGVNIVLKVEGSGDAGATAGVPTPAAAPSGAAPVDASAPTAEKVGDIRVTVSLTNIPLIEALKYVTGLANLKFKVEPNTVVVVPLSEFTDVLVTKEWKIPADLIPRDLVAPATVSGSGTANAAPGGGGIADRESIKNWLLAKGVTFNGAASAIYILKTSRLIVRNTQDQLDRIDEIMKSASDQGPASVEIECRFVEFRQDQFGSLDIEALLGRSHTVTTPDALNVGGTSEDGSYRPPTVFAICGVLTDPQFQIVMRALGQKKSVGLISAPKVPIKSGHTAAIKAVRESGDSNEDTPPQISRTDNPKVTARGQSAGGGGGSKVPAAVALLPPARFENRSMCVTLDVKPLVGSDGYTIDLDLTSQIVEFDRFLSEGGPVTPTVRNPGTGISQWKFITADPTDQPLFSTRKTTTKVSVFDGSTVVLRDMLREVPDQQEDQVQPTGHQPIVVPSSHTGVAPHRNCSILIFVTARLINASSGPVRSDEEKEDVVETVAPPTVAPIDLPLMPKE